MPHAVRDGCETKIHHHVGPSSFLCAHSSGWNAPEKRNRFSSLYGRHLGDMGSAAEGPKKKQKRDDRCARSAVLRRKARKIVRLLAVDQSLKAKVKLPSDFVCGSLRSKIRSIYASELTPVQELSIKTAIKAEVQPCEYCEALQHSHKLETWRKARLAPAECSEEHLSAFGRAFSENVPKGWNNRKTPYIPNGASSLFASRREGGNWVDQPFSPETDVKLIYSSGKPRIVTLYSSHNVSVLTPLHHSLYAYLKGRNWLLVGSPTNERLRYCADGGQGTEWLSFDYESATDNIKTVYVQRAVDILIDKADGLTDDEIRCLRVLSSLSLDGVDAVSGQPMGSPMSFPLLCLINKTVVDLALSDLLIKGEISFNEWTSHRCLINGDDLLMKSTSKGDLVEAVARQGSFVGLRTNKEKTMRHSEYGEINSTVFKNCELQKKTNVSALWMASEVCDSLGFAQESCSTQKGFLMVALANKTRLARQKIKIVSDLPTSRKKAIMRCHKLRLALASKPQSSVPEGTNLFPVEVVSDDFSLTRQEEAAAIIDAVQSIKERKLWCPLFLERRSLLKQRKGVKTEVESVPLRRLWSRLRPEKPKTERRTLSLLVRFWEKKRKEQLLAVDAGLESPGLIVSDLSGIGRLIDAIKRYKSERTGDRTKTQPSLVDDCFSNGTDFVSLSDGI